MHVSLLNLRIGYAKTLCRVDAFDTSAMRVKIAGRNGVGKTTLLLGLGGVRPTVRGTVVIDGQNTSLGRRSTLCNVMSDAVALPGATVAQVIRFLSAIAHPEFNAQFQVEALGLHNFAEESCARVSSGTQQKLRVLAAIARQPRWLLLDEPLEHLDAESRAHVAAQIANYPGSVWFTDHSGLLPFDATLRLARYAAA